MASFSSWILSIAGIVLTGVLIDLILPNGQTNKYIKSIFSIFVIFVTISPLINLINKDIDLNTLVNSQIQIDQNYIEHINNSRVLALNKSITNEAEKYGLNGIDIEFIIDEKTTTLKIEKVNIYLIPNFRNTGGRFYTILTNVGERLDLSNINSYEEALEIDSTIVKRGGVILKKDEEIDSVNFKKGKSK